MEIWRVRFPYALAKTVRDEAKKRGIAQTALVRDLVQRGLDTAPETLTSIVSQAIDHADRRVLHELPTRHELGEIVEAAVSRALEPYIDKPGR